ncbi:MAG: TerB family tellurite resistance protein [Gemmatimonadales bacterium]
MVALGGFLSQRGVIHPFTVFLVSWFSSMATAAVVYQLSRRFGRSFFAGRVGKRLLTPASLARMEREYLRFGLAGIFVCRVLPGFRSFVAPFAGLVGLAPGRTLVTMGLASGVWYGSMVYLGTAVGVEWEAITRLLAEINRTLGVGAGLVLAGLLVWIIVRRARPRRDRLWWAIDRAFSHDLNAQAHAHNDPAAAAAATLLLELAHRDRTISASELGLIESYLRDRWDLSPRESPAPAAQEVVGDTAEFAGHLARRYDRVARLELLARLRQVALTGEVLTAHEGRLLGRAAELLGLGAEATERVEPRTGL